MAVETLYNQRDPTTSPIYVTVSETNATYSTAFTVSEAGTAKEIWFYSPAMAGSGTVLPNHVGIFAADNLVALVHVNPVTWSGAEGSGWIKATIPDTALSPGTVYFAAIASDDTAHAIKQAYLYGSGDSTAHLTPWSSADSKISTATSPLSGLVHGPNGPVHPYVNSIGFAYPATPAPDILNWLVDVGISFGSSAPPTITTTALPDAVRLYDYSQAVTADNGDGALTWSITGGALPSGLSLNSSTGIISGDAVATGFYAFTITATDIIAQSDSANLSINVVALKAGTPVVIGGISTYSITSGINNTGNAGPQNLRVLPPVSPAIGRSHAFLWVLPVEPGQGTTFGDGIGYMKTLGVHDTYNVTCIQPGFPLDPWYADSDLDPQTQQSAFMVDLVNWAESTLALTGHEKHYLIGFSKSGFGGQLLFWQHNDIFEKVASWDAAANYQAIGEYDGAPVIGDQTHLDAIKLYDPNLLSFKSGTNTGDVNRIWLGAGVNLITATSDYSARLTADGIQHTYAETVTDVHNWVTTPPWVPTALAAIFGTIQSNDASMSVAFI